MTDFVVGDWGIQIGISFAKEGIAFDPAGGEVTLEFRKPNGVVVRKSATIADQKAHYTVEENFLDQDGIWQLLIILTHPAAEPTLRVHKRTTFRVGVA
jgi:hypothetical protein